MILEDHATKYIFPMLIVFDKLFPVTLIISLSQCSCVFRLIFTSDLYLLSIYISNPHMLLHFILCVIQSYPSKQNLEKSWDVTVPVP